MTQWHMALPTIVTTALFVILLHISVQIPPSASHWLSALSSMSSAATSLRDDIGGAGGGGTSGGAAGFTSVSSYWQALCQQQSSSFTAQQRNVCMRLPASVAFVYMGAGHAIRECKRQFFWHRWNCSVEHSLLRAAAGGAELSRPRARLRPRAMEPAGAGRAVNTSVPQRRLRPINRGDVLNQGTRETAFLRAIINAGVVYAVTLACSAGNLSDCACAPDPGAGPYGMMNDQQMQAGSPGAMRSANFRSAPGGVASGARAGSVGRYGQVSGSGSGSGSRSGTGSGPAFMLSGEQQQQQQMLQAGVGGGADGGAAQQQQSGAQQEVYMWTGCSDNIQYGVRLAHQFVDSAEDGLLEAVDGSVFEPSEIPVPRRIRRLINLHNNKVGRRVIESSLRQVCRCYGVSGSCSTKMCMRKLPPFEEVAATLKRQYWRAAMVAKAVVRPAPYQTPAPVGGRRWGGRSRQTQQRPAEDPTVQLVRRDRGRRHVQINEQELVFLETSASYCTANTLRGILGTRERVCRRFPPSSEAASGAQYQQLQQPAYGAQPSQQYYGGVGGYSGGQSAYSGVAARSGDAWESSGNDIFEGSCDELCCGRGYNTFTEQRREQCNCKFIWCCEVQCQQCLTTEEKHICN